MSIDERFGHAFKISDVTDFYTHNLPVKKLEFKEQ